MYADDVKIYLPVFDLASHALLQEDLNRVVAWAVKWKLKLNAKKCVLLRLKPNLNLPSYMLDNTLLVMPDVVKDLGVFITPIFDFSYHCNHIANIAFKQCHLILSAFITRDNDFLLRMFNVYVRPLLEYSSQVWAYLTLIKLNQCNVTLQNHFPV